MIERESMNYFRRIGVGVLVVGILFVAMIANVGDREVVQAQGAASPTPTRTPTVKPTNEGLPFPVRPITNDQLAEARACEDYLLRRENRENVDVPSKTCELLESAVRWESRTLFSEVMKANPAYAFTRHAFYTFAEEDIPLVDVPSAVNQPITKVILRYTWQGLGNWYDYTIVITEADTDTPIVSITDRTTIGKGERLPPTKAAQPPPVIDPALVQALAGGVTNLLPVQQFTPLQICCDNYPDWTVGLTFANGLQLMLTTDQSNLFGGGGPWHIFVGEQRYIQYSSAFAKRVGAIFEALRLPITPIRSRMGVMKFIPKKELPSLLNGYFGF